MDKGAIVQVHVTRACNLRCRHCYSESGPEHRSGLDLHEIVTFLDWAYHHGYSHLSLSGGEPFLYTHLKPLLAHARETGWQISTATNGTLLQNKSARDCLEYLDLVGVSFDGPPSLHNDLRQRKTAFARAEQGLAVLRSIGIPFLIAHTLTRESLAELDWTLSFAVDSGAGGLRLHPLEQQGFGAAMGAVALSPAEEALAYMWVLDRRRQVPNGFRLEVDLANRELVCGSVPSCRSEQELVNPLVVHPNGELLPFTYGMPASWSFGSARCENARAAANEWPLRTKPLLERAKAEAARLEWPFFNWFEHLVRTAGMMAA